MKKLLSLLLLLSALQSHAQIHYRPPSNPAINVSGYEPTSVLRPVSPSDLSANLLSAFDLSGRLRPDIGLELAPYWLGSKRLSWQDYQNPSVGQAFLQTLQISAANVNDTALNRRVQSLGLRFQLLSGRPSDAYLKLNEERLEVMTFATWANSARSLAGSELRTTAAAIEWLADRLTEDNYSASFLQLYRERSKIVAEEFAADEVQAFLEALIEKYTDEPIFQRSAEASRERVGFFLELADGIVLRPADSSGRRPEFHRMQAWLSASYISNDYNQWTFTARYTLENQMEHLQKFDAGLSYAKATGKFEMSVEAVYRFQNWSSLPSPLLALSEEEKTTYRLAANLNYHFSDDIFLNFSLGKDYDSPFYQAGFFSLLGLNFDMFKPTTVVDNEGTP